jgi:hypothetical protein
MFETELAVAAFEVLKQAVPIACFLLRLLFFTVD